MNLIYPLPRDSKKVFDVFCTNNKKYINLSLLLDRYIGYAQNWEFRQEGKNQFLKFASFDNNLISTYYQRWQKRIDSFPYKQHFIASPEWRMVVGLGQTSILETSITLDRITGIPVIPGSALKGLAASYAMLCDLKETERFNAENHPVFKAVFGSEKESGDVIFLDAIPKDTPKLELDIMNNHYPDYYSDTTGKTFPTPDQNPNPVYFLTLGKKSKFAFAVVSRTRNQDSQNLVEHACKWLKGGLSKLGIGAKTAAGYGYFNLS